MSIETLKRDIKILEDWKRSKEKQQITYPLDIHSVNSRKTTFNKPKNLTFKIVTDGLLVNIEKQFYSPFLYTDLFALGLGIRWKNKTAYVVAMRGPAYTFTVVAATDVFTSSHSLQNGDVIYVASSGILPAGLDETTGYVVTNATATTFKLSGVNVTDTGSGTHYFIVSL